MKKISLLLACLLALLVTACPVIPPDYVGLWVDSTTLLGLGTTVTFNLSADEGTITIVSPVPANDPVFTANLVQDGTTLTATITALSVGGAAVPDALVDGALALKGIASRTQSFTYSVVGDTLTITGTLILALTGSLTNTLTAVK